MNRYMLTTMRKVVHIDEMRKAKITLAISQRTLDLLTEYSKKEAMSRQEYIRHLIDRGLKTDQILEYNREHSEVSEIGSGCGGRKKVS